MPRNGRRFFLYPLREDLPIMRLGAESPQQVLLLQKQKSQRLNLISIKEKQKLWLPFFFLVLPARCGTTLKFWGFVPSLLSKDYPDLLLPLKYLCNMFDI